MLLELFREIINEHLEDYAPGEKSIPESIPVLQEVISSTTIERDQWDNSDD
jgi:hypothetical protein